MLERWATRGRGTAVRVTVALAAFGCCLAAAAYAATKPGIGSIDVGDASRPLKPRLLEAPTARTFERRASFRFVQPPRPPARARPGRPPSFECRIDEGRWAGCDSPTVLRGVDLGRHSFEVRAVNTAGHSGPVVGREWRVMRATQPVEPTPSPTVAPVTPVPPETPVEPRPPSGRSLEIDVDASSLQPLFPGEPTQQLPLTITNPNPSPVLVTAITFVAETETPDCDVATNFELTPAAISETAPLEVPAEGSAALPVAGVAAPEIAMRDLPYPQDACEGAQLELDFQAQAHG